MPSSCWNRTIWAAFIVAMVALTNVAQADGPGRDRLVQAPQLDAPTRGSLAGALADKQWGPGDVSRGAFSLPFPASLPEGRGPLLLPFLPTYSPEAGLSEWGLGWAGSLAISRFRTIGDIGYDDDDAFASPWGRLARGDDGAWYPADLKTYVRLTPEADGWHATLQNGTQITFSNQVAVRSPRGVFAWYVVRAIDLTGHQTTFGYDINESGRPYLAEVNYGGRRGRFAHRIRIAYENVPHPATRWDSGEPVVLDRRIREVAVEQRHAQTGNWQPRFSYALSFVEDHVGPAFFLRSVVKTFASGASEPPVVFTHALWSDELDDAVAQPNSKLQAYLDTAGSHPWAGTLDPRHATLFDVDGDGRTDIETAFDHSVMRQTDTGWERQASPPLDSAHALCRPPAGALSGARNLARLMPADGEHYVFDAATHDLARTRITICNRGGQLLHDDLVDGAWKLGPRVRLVDVNRDHAPDLVWVGRGEYRVLPNTSKGGRFDFGPAHSGKLEPAVEPETVWLHDVNGDGIADIVALVPSGLLTWYGKGNFEFAEQATFLKLDGLLGPFIVKAQDEIYFVDANRDGLADLVVLRSGHGPALFINNGAGLRQHAPQSIERLAPGAFGAIAFGDFSGSGNTELAIVANGQADALGLNTPATSLLTRINDGRGMEWRLEYERAKPQEGTWHRAAVLAAVTAEGSGKEPTRTQFAYDGAVLHSESEQLAGFAHVAMHRDRTREESEFHHDDITTGLLVSSHRFDPQMPQLQQRSTNRYGRAMYHGLPFLRQERNEDTLEDAASGQAMSRSEEVHEWANPWCPILKIRTTPHGRWEQQTFLDDVPRLNGLPHCLVRQEIQRGTHGDPELDFYYILDIARDDFGNVIQVSLPGTPSLVLQMLEYDTDQRIARVANPGSGATEFTYEDETGLLAQITYPTGVRKIGRAREPLTDALTALVDDHGDGHAHNQGFGFDAQERLASRWDNLGETNASSPLEKVGYRYAAADSPGLQHSRLAREKGAVADTASLFTGDGGLFAQAGLHAEGWQISNWTKSAPLLGRNATYRGGPLRSLATDSLEQLTFGLLSTGAVELESSYADGLGRIYKSGKVIQQGVSASEETVHKINKGALHATTRDTTGREVTRTTNVDQHVVMSSDGTATTQFVYDAAGRMRRAILPDGSTHSVVYDEQGRLHTISRDGVASIAYFYVPGTEQVELAQVRDKNGHLTRSIEYRYDQHGRRIEERHSAQDAQEQHFVFYYDGATPGGEHIPGQLGFLTGIAGEGFEKSFSYEANGLLKSKTLKIVDWRTVRQDFSYFADGSLRGSTTSVQGESQPFFALQSETQLDAHGRSAGYIVNGAPLYTLRRDAHGDVIGANVDSQLEITFSRDPTTWQKNGIVAASPAWDSEAAFTWDRDASGHVAEEYLTFGAQDERRTYGYNARGFLRSARNADKEQLYHYDLLGVRAPATLTAVDTDSLGRIVRHNDKVFTYNAAGQIACARAKSGRSATYLYDESGARIFKAIDGVPSLMFADGDVIGGADHVRPVEIDGWRLGFLVNGHFVHELADARGTRLIDAKGQVGWAGPFGDPVSGLVRDGLIFAKQNFDPDTATYRMGLRDFDPALGRFITPDPLFLNDPALCARSPLQCNLFAFGLNDPLLFSDPTGLAAEDIWGRCSNSGQYESSFIHKGRSHDRAESPQNWRLRTLERGGIQESLVQPDMLLASASLGWQLTRSVALTAHNAVVARLFSAGMSEQALSHMIGQHVRVHSFEGIQAASEFLIERGVPRKFRKDILQSFVAGTVKFEIAEVSIFGVRFWGGKANRVGKYLFPTFTPLTNTANLALPQQFNSAQYIWGAEISQGAAIISGRAAQQLKYGSQYVGGAEQLFVLDASVPGVLR